MTQPTLEAHEQLLARHEELLAELRRDELVMASARSSLPAEIKAKLAAVVQALDLIYESEPQKLASVVDKLHQDSAG